MYRGNYIPIGSFKGGYCGNKGASQLTLEQAADLDNIVLGIDGKGFRSRLGNTALNGTALASGASIHGINYVLKSNGTDFLSTIAGAKLYAVKTDGSGQTDITGAITISTGATQLWDMFVFNDAVIGFGGDPTSPDAPFSWDFNLAHNAAALGGSPPSAYGAFTANNRVFAYRTNAAPSTIYWSILANAGDWTGTGSGSAVVGSLSDGQKITGARVLSTNYVLIFKEASTYQMVIQSNPFPIYSLFSEIGCVGKNASINIDGIVYWINQYGRMVSTDGENVKTYSSDADDLWNLVTPAKRGLISAVRQKGADYDWIVWIVSTNNGTNNAAIVWDLLNHCWLRHTTGYKMNLATKDNYGRVYMGGYDGVIYKPDQATTYSDASEAGAAIASYWRTGWMNSNLEKIEQIRRITVEYDVRASGTITINYGFDFVADSSNFSLSQVAAGSETTATRFGALSGRGNYVQIKIGHSSSTIDSKINQVLLGGKAYGQKRFTNL